jgi:hypothetical protein
MNEVLLDLQNAIFDTIYNHYTKQYQTQKIHTAPADSSTTVRSWLRHYATSWLVAGLISDEVIGFFN